MREKSAKIPKIPGNLSTLIYLLAMSYDSRITHAGVLRPSSPYPIRWGPWSGMVLWVDGCSVVSQAFSRIELLGPSAGPSTQSAASTCKGHVSITLSGDVASTLQLQSLNPGSAHAEVR